MFTAKVGTQWLLESVSKKSADDVLAEARSFDGLKEQPYVGTPVDHTLPKFESGYHFHFEQKGTSLCVLEILTTKGNLLQAGMQIHFRRMIFGSTAIKILLEIKTILESNFLHESVFLMPDDSTQGFAFEDDELTTYVTLRTIGLSRVINLRIGNQKYWKQPEF